MPRFDIIITVWNRKGYTARTLASLINSGAIEQCDRFIIVDNCSTEEGMYEAMDAIYKDTPGVSGKVFLLRRAKNDGWATSVNDAINLSRAEYVLLLNNDEEFEMDFMQKAFAVIGNVEAWTQGTKKIGILGLWRHTSHGDKAGGVKTNMFVETDDSPAVAWLMSKEAMIQVGMLTEKGPCMERGGNGEDSDYTRRMKEAGFLVGSPIPDLAHHIDGY